MVKKIFHKEKLEFKIFLNLFLLVILFIYIIRHYYYLTLISLQLFLIHYYDKLFFQVHYTLSQLQFPLSSKHYYFYTIIFMIKTIGIILNKAKYKILLANFVLTQNNIEKLLLSKANNDVIVQGVIENRLKNSKGAMIKN
jgi:hypothetical protein